MPFRVFLEGSRVRPWRARGYVASAALHLALALALAALWTRSEARRPTPASPAIAVLLRAGPPDRGALAGGPPEAAPPHPAPPPSRRRGHGRLATEVVPLEVIRLVEAAPSAPLALSAASIDVSGTGDGRGAGSGNVRRRRDELAGRVVGDGTIGGGAHGLPYVSRREATSLRTYDFFPRLPASLWRGEHAYVVMVELCVSEEGRVSDAALVVRTSPELDPVVLDAVRTWRYRPRLVDGRAGPFCHVVTIKYERS